MIIKRKGEEQQVAQNLAYLYNDCESQGQLAEEPYTNGVFAQQDGV
jgi:hypothetical protein